MFDIGWSEMLVIAVVMIVVVGPKDLPRMLRTFGKFTSKMTGMAADFRKQFDEALKEADLDDVKTSIDSVRKLDPRNDIRKALSPMEKAAADVRAGLDSVMKPKSAVQAEPASTEPKPAEPLKNGPVPETGKIAVSTPVPATVSTAPAPVPLTVTPPQATEPAAPKTAAPKAAPKPKAKPVTAVAASKAASKPAAASPSKAINGASVPAAKPARKSKQSGTTT